MQASRSDLPVPPPELVVETWLIAEDAFLDAPDNGNEG